MRSEGGITFGHCSGYIVYVSFALNRVHGSLITFHFTSATSARDHWKTSTSCLKSEDRVREIHWRYIDSTRSANTVSRW